MTTRADPTTRFSSRVDNYVKTRPGYPDELIPLLEKCCDLTPQAVVADIGFGTGLSTLPFLQYGNRVYGVEPNKEMRQAGEAFLGRYKNFVSVVGTAEYTKLPNKSMDYIIAGQAFHWFDRVEARKEFVRVLKPGGTVALIWNDRKTDATPFLKAYEKLLVDFSTDYREVNHRNIDEKVIAEFFAPNKFATASLPYAQHFNYARLEGRLMSSSYAPDIGHPRYEPMLKKLREIYDTHQVNDSVTFEYDTLIYYGKL
ncbi:MAG: class I SAM-dependent methyltransferase [Burkholderiales bacterium]